MISLSSRSDFSLASVSVASTTDCSRAPSSWKLLRKLTTESTITATTIAGTSKNVSTRSRRVRSAMSPPNGNSLRLGEHDVSVQDDRALGEELRELLANVVERVSFGFRIRLAAGGISELDRPEVAPGELHRGNHRALGFDA